MSTQFIKIEEGKLKGIKLNSLWLRERLSGEKYVDPNNFQRLYEPSLLDENLGIIKHNINNNILNVEFTDGTSGSFSINDLFDEINFIDAIPEKDPEVPSVNSTSRILLPMLCLIMPKFSSNSDGSYNL